MDRPEVDIRQEEPAAVEVAAAGLAGGVAVHTGIPSVARMQSEDRRLVRDRKADAKSLSRRNR